MKRLGILILLVLLLCGCALQQQEPVKEKLTLVQEGAYTLSDGTRIDHWVTEIFENTVYQTADGWELLRIPPRVDIANVSVAYLEGFQHLSEAAQEKVRAYYEENTPELDVAELLEAAWQDLNTISPEMGMFSPWWAHQDVFPVAYNASIMCFAAETTIVGSDKAAQIDRVHTIFHRESGEVLEIWDLFTVDRDAAMDIIARALAQNAAQFEEIRAALEGENVVRLQQGGMECFFPLGTLSWSEYDCFMYLDCAELDIWQDWAITEKID